MNVKATIVLPTTRARKEVLPFSVGSILRQTISEIELFIIGDGVDAETRSVIQALADSDNRIRFFDHPKGESRGELYRHKALTEHARGEIVCYLLDRDLMLPDHVEKMYDNLKRVNFCSHAALSILKDNTIEILLKYYIGNYEGGMKENASLVRRAEIQLSLVGHTLAFYKQLPFGWRITPPGQYTDRYMWQQFAVHKNFRFASTVDITILYFKRDDHPGWPAKDRARDMKPYFELLDSKTEIENLKKKALANLMIAHDHLKGNVVLSILEKPLSEIPATILNKLKRIVFKGG
jgi:glycosyltransferase involved in cell wall biosynthesis